MACRRVTDRLRQDAFLGGRLRLWQPEKGYRAGVDPVILAASVPARPGQSLLDLGCGAGAAMLCLGARVPGVALAGLDLQEGFVDLARRNAEENGIAAEVHRGDLAEMPAALRAQRFDHVIANPPYFDRADGKASADPARETAMGEATPLSDWVAAAVRRCAPKGYVSVIHRAERLPELLALMAARLGAVQVLPLIPRAGRPARLVLIRGRMGSRAPFRLHDGLVMHDGPTHMADRQNYTPALIAILRDGSGLGFPV